MGQKTGDHQYLYLHLRSWGGTQINKTSQNWAQFLEVSHQELRVSCMLCMDWPRTRRPVTHAKASHLRRAAPTAYGAAQRQHRWLLGIANYNPLPRYDADSTRLLTAAVAFASFHSNKTWRIQTDRHFSKIEIEIDMEWRSSHAERSPQISRLPILGQWRRLRKIDRRRFLNDLLKNCHYHVTQPSKTRSRNRWSWMFEIRPQDEPRGRRWGRRPFESARGEWRRITCLLWRKNFLKGETRRLQRPGGFLQAR